MWCWKIGGLTTCWVSSNPCWTRKSTLDNSANPWITFSDSLLFFFSRSAISATRSWTDVVMANKLWLRLGYGKTWSGRLWMRLIKRQMLTASLWWYVNVFVLHKNQTCYMPIHYPNFHAILFSLLHKWYTTLCIGIGCCCQCSVQCNVNLAATRK